MKIKDAIKNGKLPNVKIESIFQSLERLGINVSKNSRTAEYDLEDKIIDKLRIYINASISFNKYNNEVNNEIKTTHNDLMSKYDSLINKYKNIIKNMQSDPSKEIDLANIDLKDFPDHFKLDVRALMTQISKLNDAKNNYKNVIDNISLTDDNLGLDIDVLNDFEEKSLKNTNIKLGQTEMQIQEFQEEIDKLNNMKITSKFKQKRINNKKNGLMKKLNKLQEKQGKLKSKQAKIVNKGSSKYIKIKSTEFEELLQEAQTMSDYQEAMSENQAIQSGIKTDLESTRQELEDLRGKTGIRASIERGRLNRETKKLQRSQEVLKKQQDRINGLKNKTGYCNLSSQILRTYTAAYSR